MRLQLPVIKFEKGYGRDDGVVFIESSQVKFVKHGGYYNPGNFSGLKSYSEITMNDGSVYLINLGNQEVLRRIS